MSRPTKHTKKSEGLIDFASFPKWGTPEHAEAERKFRAEQGPMLPALPIISDAEFRRLQDKAAKYRHK